MIIDDYIETHNAFRAKYGNKTVVFYQIGDFFELSAYEQDGVLHGANIRTVCDLLNLQLTRKNKSVPEATRANPFMAGFPLYALQKYIQVLMAHAWTVVVVRQVTAPPNPKRAVTEVVSPATFMGGGTTPHDLGQFLMAMAWEEPAGGGPAVLAAAVVDLTTGVARLFEMAGTAADPYAAPDEAARLLQVYAPREIVLLGEVGDALRADEEARARSTGAAVHAKWNDVPPAFGRVAYQNAVFEKAYPNPGLVSAIEALDLERAPLLRLAFAYVLQFAYEHNETILSKLQRPERVFADRRLHLHAGAAAQLNLVSCAAGDAPLVALLNRCKTAFGARLFRERLLNPVSCSETLAARYAAIASLRSPERRAPIEAALKNMGDLERVVRRIHLATLPATDWAGLASDLVAAAAALRAGAAVGVLGADALEGAAALGRAVEHVHAHLDVDEAARGDAALCGYVQRGQCADLDALAAAWRLDRARFDAMAAALSPDIRTDCNERDGYFLTTTKRRWDAIARSDKDAWSARPLSAASANVRLVHAELSVASDRLVAAEAKMAALAAAYYKDFLASFPTDAIAAAAKHLAALDVAATSARNAEEFGHVTPALAEGAPRFEARGLRHAILERLNGNTLFVPNDVRLEGGAGMLLYGINASGKSSLMKAVGLCIVMAQAGMCVPCTSLTLAPYRHLFTRITSSDNMFRGLSTFTLEMLELRNILQRCDEASIVLGDELCAGTEAVSAIAIVGAGVGHLVARRTTFVFATHLHELLKVLPKDTLDAIQVRHMHVEVRADGTLVYDRSLREGSGSAVYGLEVCRGLHMPPEFLRSAHVLRAAWQGQSPYLVAPKPSRYCADRIVDACSVCGAPAAETHHILQQKDADAAGLVAGHVPVHAAANLAVLCEACHLSAHRGCLDIRGYVQTSHGVALDVTARRPADREAVPALSIAELADCLRATAKGWAVRPGLTRTSRWRSVARTDAETLERFLHRRGLPWTLEDLEAHRHKLF